MQARRNLYWEKINASLSTLPALRSQHHASTANARGYVHLKFPECGKRFRLGRNAAA